MSKKKNKHIDYVEFKCPMCNVVIPDEYVAKKTMPVEFEDRIILVCIDCGKEYEAMVQIVMERRMAEQYAEKSDLTPEQILAIREEQKEMQKEDEALVDEEVDVMDNEKMEKVFKKRGDGFEEKKKPLEVMREKFMEGLRKQRRRRGIISIPHSLN